jgi:hypothetical protein
LRCSEWCASRQKTFCHDQASHDAGNPLEGIAPGHPTFLVVFEKLFDQVLRKTFVSRSSIRLLIHLTRHRLLLSFPNTFTWLALENKSSRDNFREAMLSARMGANLPQTTRCVNGMSAVETVPTNAEPTFVGCFSW